MGWRAGMDGAGPAQRGNAQLQIANGERGTRERQGMDAAWSQAGEDGASADTLGVYVHIRTVLMAGRDERRGRVGPPLRPARRRGC